jgi:hypothetical protein
MTQSRILYWSLVNAVVKNRVFIKDGELLGKLSDYKLLDKDCTSRS